MLIQIYKIDKIIDQIDEMITMSVKHRTTFRIFRQESLEIHLITTYLTTFYVQVIKQYIIKQLNDNKLSILRSAKLNVHILFCRKIKNFSPL